MQHQGSVCKPALQVAGLLKIPDFSQWVGTLNKFTEPKVEVIMGLTYIICPQF